MNNVNKRVKNIKKPKNILILHQYNELLGTAKDEDLDIINDYDLQEYANFKDNKYIYNLIHDKFKEIIKDIKNNDDMYLIDFKLGRLPSTEQIRWSYNDVMKGYKIIDDEKINFVDALHQKSIIKIDIIYIDDNRALWEISNNYYISIGDFKTYNDFDINDIKKNLLIDFKQLYYNDNNKYKSLKRLYSYYKLDHNKKKMNILQNIFNSQLGYDNKLMSDLKTLLLLIDNKFRRIERNIIYNTLIILKNNENNKYYQNLMNKLIDNFKNLNKNEIIKEINDIIDIIYNNVNIETEKYISKYKLLNLNIE